MKINKTSPFRQWGCLAILILAVFWTLSEFSVVVAKVKFEREQKWKRGLFAIISQPMKPELLSQISESAPENINLTDEKLDQTVADENENLQESQSKGRATEEMSHDKIAS